MLLKMLSSIFRARPAPVASGMPASYAGPRHHGFIAFVADVDAPTFLAVGDRIDAGQASLRLRVWLPALELLRFAPVCLVPLHHIEHDPELVELGEVRAIIVGKFSVQRITAEPARFRALARWVEKMAARYRVVADFCDDLEAATLMFGRPEPAEFQQCMARACALTVSTTALRERLERASVHGVTVIEDPYERETAAAPQFSPQAGLRLAWFGVFGPPLLPLLEAQFGAIAQRVAPRPVEIAFITHPTQAELVRDLGGSLLQSSENCTLRFVPWSREAVAAELAMADMVVLPQDAATEWGRVKSHNRLVETLRAGRFAIASPVPAYRELGDYAWIGGNLADGVEWALAHPAEVLVRIRSGQAAVAERFSPRRIGELWAAALGLSLPCDEASLVRLNLGCGDKILAGYVNVDLAADRVGRQPDLVCDLRRLEPVADASVDEVLAIHVVEHFWQWEVLEVLREWLRVMKPGARMVLECPNLLAACEALLRDPESGAGPGLEGQRTMWVLYGDPAWRDPLMCHRWNYTPHSLGLVMREAGLVNVRQEPAQFKLREPRDMRLVGEKAR